jgi:2-C-methyl-D-erythritol 4-phosphate cytidylyltransferase
MEVAGGRPLLAWSLAEAEDAGSVTEIIIVAGDNGRASIEQVVDGGAWSKPTRVVAGGERRQDSVAAGVLAAVEDSDVILVHDGARPLAPASLFDECAAAAMSHGAAIAAIPVSDTLKRVEAGRISETVSRSSLWAAQTPQGFRRSTIVPLVRWATSSDTEFTDEASLLEARGTEVHVVQGSRLNLKVTVREDLAMVDALLRLRAAREPGVIS